jgi:hypothetical protein
MSDFGTPQPPPPPPPPPAFPVPPPPAPPGRTGPPWEQAGQSLQSFIDTAKTVLTDPTTAFSQMRREGGLVAPLVYYLIGMLIGVLGSMIWQFAGLGAGWGPGAFGMPDAGLAVGMGASLIAIPIICTIGLFIGALIVHVALGLFGGQRYPFETTFRVLAYAQGSALPIAILPVCGGIAAGIWGLIVAIVGLAQAQETTIGKAAAAVLTPTVICCALWFLVIASFVMLLVGGAAAGFGH